MTRAQTKAKLQTEEQALLKESRCQVAPNPVKEPPPFPAFDDEIFQTSRTRPVLTRREKREACRRHGLIRAKDPPAQWQKMAAGIGVNRQMLQQQQETDDTLDSIREAADRTPNPLSRGTACFTGSGSVEPVMMGTRLNWLPKGCTGACTFYTLCRTPGTQEDICSTCPTLLLAVHEPGCRRVLQEL